MSKFSGLFDEPKTAARKHPARKRGAPPQQGRAPEAEGKKGRAPGKRSDPAYTQITAYLRKRDLPDFKAKLAKAGLDMSDFFQAKIDEYLST